MGRPLLTFWNLHRVSILLLLLSMVFYAVFAYDLQRPDSIKLIALYGALFFLCYKLIQFEKWNLRFMVASGLLLRVVFLFALPNLSQDFYRFIWDGRLLLEGLNPFELTPDTWMERGGPAIEGAETLHQGMGPLSARNISNYPPVNQYFFALAALLGGKSLLGTVVTMRAVIILADLGILYFGRRLLRKINRAPNMIFWYFLNPLVIIELTGNLHFEGVMLFFFLLALFGIFSEKHLLASLPYALSIGVKLIPLLFLPLVLPLLGWRKSLVFFGGTALFLALSTYPVWFPEFPAQYFQTLKLWFSNFEFNASLYNLGEWLAHWQGAKPWEFIVQWGKVTPLVVALLTLAVSLHPALKKPKFWFSGALLVCCAYYFLATVVHPWYLIFPLLLSVFTDFRFVILWSATAVLSYTAYAVPEVQERPMILLLEYSAVFGLMVYEILRNRKNLLPAAKNSRENPPD